MPELAKLIRSIFWGSVAAAILAAVAMSLSSVRINFISRGTHKSTPKTDEIPKQKIIIFMSFEFIFYILLIISVCVGLVMRCVEWAIIEDSSPFAFTIIAVLALIMAILNVFYLYIGEETSYLVVTPQLWREWSLLIGALQFMLSVLHTFLAVLAYYFYI